MAENKEIGAPIGVFDSGYGGLTILRDIKQRLPQYDYLYLGDNARAPYGNRSFDVVYEFTLQAVEYLFSRGCRLVILGCNTASAKALRSIQQRDLPRIAPSRRVLGVIRPTVEVLGSMSKSGKIGVMGTRGTIQSHSYDMEMAKIAPGIELFSQACPMWVPLIENKEYDQPGAEYVGKGCVEMLMAQCPDIDTILLACTHYPLLADKIAQYLPSGVTLVSQGPIVSESRADYLLRHPEIESLCSQGGTVEYLTTEHGDNFGELASVFLGEQVEAQHITL